MIRTFVFLDLETTNLITQNAMPSITELSLVAVSRNAILSSSNNLPRVQHKLVLPIHPKTNINERVQSLTKLSNENLEEVQPFECGTYDILKHFLKRLTPPLCFVAHNGNNFDYPIFLWELACINKVIDEEILCIDTLELFREFFSKKRNEQICEIQKNEDPSPTSSSSTNFHSLLEDGYDEMLSTALDAFMKDSTPKSTSEQKILVKDEFRTTFLGCETRNVTDALNESRNSIQTDDKENTSIKTPSHKPHTDMQKVNEKTPENQIIKSKNQDGYVCIRQGKNVRKKLDFTANKPINFKLGTIYKHMLGMNQLNAHNAEGDCLTTLHCVCQIAYFFVKWADNNAKPLKSLKKR